MHREEADRPASTNGAPARTVAIFGGGLAGLAATEALASRGIKVTLHEARQKLGGRASSFVDQKTGEVIDNCQHVAMGCCTNFLDFCQRVGISDQFRRLDSLLFVDERNRHSRLRNGPWPAPFHLTGSFLRLRHFNRRQRQEIVRGLRQLIASREDGRSFQNWLDDQQQSDKVQRDFWQIVLVSALSESLDRIQFSAARQVFLQGFLSHRNAWKVSLPTVPLHELYGEQLLEHFWEQGVELRLQSRLKEFRCSDQRIEQARLANGEDVAADAYILALPWHAVPRLFADDSPGPSFCGQAEQLESAPISSVHLWFDKPLTAETHAVLLGRVSQWVFNRSAIQNLQTPEWHYYQIVISQSRELSNWSQEEIVEKVQQELATLWPETHSSAKLLHSRVVREHQAVFSMTPGSDDFRPDQQTEISNLFLAGDWTRTGWPATMEGAVRSGYLAAEKLLQRWGIPDTICSPDLPRSRLANWLGLIPADEAG